MRYLFIFLTLLTLPFLTKAQKVVSITIDGEINAVTADFVQDALEDATNKKAQCLLIHLNTPGGLLQSTREIVSTLLASKLPTVVYVAPEGAHAGSAGVFITMAANIAAMSEASNIGAAHPVSMQGNLDSVMNEKVTNDAAAFIRSIAAKRNRNLQWAEDAVRKSIAIPAAEAVLMHVVDMIAFSDRDLLTRIDGRSVQLNNKTVILQTKNAPIENYEMSGIAKILSNVSNPNIAYLLMMLGIFGILFELFSPGAILPGIVGVISLILAFYAMRTLPVNYAGLALIIFSVILFLLELKIVSHGMLAIGGIISLLFGSLMLIKASSPLEIHGISTALIIGTTAVAAFFFLVVITAGIKSQKRVPVTGIEAMIGVKGVTMDPLNPEGMVKVKGEIWKATTSGESIAAGEPVIINSINKFVLHVEKVTS